MRLIELTSDYEIKPFDCGDAALNGFLRNDAKLFLGEWPKSPHTSISTISPYSAISRKASLGERRPA